MLLATSASKLKYDNCVFINCPFDDNYQSLFDALVFAVLDCGFAPRCAKEVNDSGQLRITKIIKIIEECRLGIHDLSRTELSHSGLPRFNMPFELGVFFGAQSFGNQRHKNKSCLILEKEKYDYQKFLSDLAGCDISAHHDAPEKVISSVRKWLIHFTKEIIPGESAIYERFLDFQGTLPALCKEQSIKPDELTFLDFIRFAALWIENQG